MSVDAPITEVVARLHRIVTPRSVADFGHGDSSWLDAFAALGVSELVAVRPPLADCKLGDHIELLTNDARTPLVTDRHVDLAIAFGIGERIPADSSPNLVDNLCAIADVVAFASVLPGLATPGTPNTRWPAWWDALFEQRGYVVHDLVRNTLWDDDRIDLVLRQGLVLYAPAGRFAATPRPEPWIRRAVHPEAHHLAITSAEERRAAELAIAGDRITSLGAEIARLREHVGWLETELADAAARPAAPDLEIQALEEGRQAYSDTVLLWAALAAAHRELAATSYTLVPPIEEAGRDLKSLVMRVVTGALPVRRRLGRLLGPRADLFDEAWYLARYPDVAASRLSPLWHYRRHGTRSGRSPHPWFDSSWYVARNPDVGEAGIDPVEHYLKTGWREDRDPHPLFSSSWYAAHHDLRGWRRSPLEHYLERGRVHGATPHPLFDREWYLAKNPTIGAAGVDPLEHFLTRGWWEGRSPHALFDLRWYLETNLDVAYEGLNPFIHYLNVGWREGRDPNPLFDVSWYLDHYPHVAEAGIEPLTHYLTTGAAEGRATGQLFDTKWYVIRHPEAASDDRNPLAYYLEFGASLGDVPSPWAEHLEAGEADDRDLRTGPSQARHPTRL